MVREQYPVLELWTIRCQFDMDLARAPRRARSNARKKGSGYENGLVCEILWKFKFVRPVHSPSLIFPRVFHRRDWVQSIRCRKQGILAKIELRIPYQRPIRFLPETDYPRASRSFPRIAGSGNEIVRNIGYRNRLGRIFNYSCASHFKIYFRL